ncbi:MAG: FtsX-like permease family protein [Anderseniella sp.]|jgi:putative ABC transport system permease protein|nr:FtsX-like permease family protein [Anderseniella sp.]
MTASLSLAFRLARRELRSGLQGFRIFLACLVLGVGAIAMVGALSAALERGIANEGRSLMGGDVEFSVLHNQPTPEQRTFIEASGRVSRVATLRAMAAVPGGPSALVEAKVADDAYPLYGTLQLSPPVSLIEALAPDPQGRPGSVVEQSLLDRLGLQVGDALRVGTQDFTINAAILREPDRISDGFVLGPRLMISDRDLEATGLARPGSLITWRYRVALPGPASEEQVKTLVEQAGPVLQDEGWRVRSRENAAPGVRRFIDRLTFFLSLVGLTALIVGGVGVANAVKAFLERRTKNIATLKCLGAPARLVFQTYLVEVLIVATLGIGLGAALGLVTPPLAGALLSSVLPVPVSAGPEWWPVARAALYGYLIVVAFAVWPLVRAGRIPPSALFRDLTAHVTAWPGVRTLAVIAAALGGIFALTYTAFPDPRVTWGYAGGIMTSFLILAGLARVLIWLAARVRHARSATARLAIANLHRPGTPAPSVVMSLGLGLTLFVTLALIDTNVSKELRDNLPDRAPAFFFLDVHSSEAEGFTGALEKAGASSVGTAPMLRGRIIKVNGVPSAEVKVSPDAAWALRGDRGITYSAVMPDNAELSDGNWWAPDHAGEPLVSFSADIGEGLGMNIGDTVTVNVLGREITAKVANFREVDWRSLQINFVMVFSPNSFAGAPHMYVVTAQAAPEAEPAILKAVSGPYPTVTSIRVRDALDAINKLMSQLITAIRGANAMTLLVGILVLGGALATGLSGRIYDAVILKTYGATRSQLLQSLVFEYAVLGLATAAFAIVAGSLSAWAIITFIMQLDWQFSLATAAATALIALVVTVAAGLITTWSALKASPARVLRVD